MDSYPESWESVWSDLHSGNRSAINAVLGQAFASGDPHLMDAGFSAIPTADDGGREWSKHVEAALSTENAKYLPAAIEAAGRLRLRDVTERLISLLSSRREIVRICAAQSLGSIGDPRAVLALTESAGNDKSSLVRSYASEALALTAGARAHSTLNNLFERERSPRARLAIAGALYEIGDSGYLRNILKALKSRRYTTRCAAANFLGVEVRTADISFVVQHLLDAQRRETTVAAGEAIQRAIDRLQRR